MATITAAETRIETWGDDAHVITWAALTTTNNYGSPVSMVGAADRSVQMTGTVGTGGVVTMYGSNIADPNLANDDDWAALNDPNGNSLALNALKIEQILEITRWIRPKITAGDGATSLNISLLLRRAHR